MKVVIMAGGKGTRISSVASDIPKPMLEIDGMPVLEHEIECLRKQGLTDLIITVSHLSAVIMDYFGNGSGISPVRGKPFGVNITYYKEEHPLGNAGALFKLKTQLGTDPFLLLNADVIFNVDFHRMIAFHYARQKSSGDRILATLFTHPNNHPYDSSLIIANQDGLVMKWLAKEEEKPQYYKNCVNAGLHIVDPAVLDKSQINCNKIGMIDKDGKIYKVDLDMHLLKPLAGTGKMLCYQSSEYVKDMGTPDRFYMVEKDFKLGRVKKRNLSCKQKAIFLDRDGTINVYKGFLKDIEDFELLPGVSKAIKKINESGYLCIVITNQPVVARGELTCSQLEEIHKKMETLLGFERAYIDKLYFCPHHPDKGYDGEIPELKIDCDCRKPKPGMLLKAAEDFNINLKESYMIGDGEIDIKAGKRAGCKTVLIGCGHKMYGQDIQVESLKEFVDNYL